MELQKQVLLYSIMYNSKYFICLFVLAAEEGGEMNDGGGNDK